ncbi:terpenoid synthase, partial [Lentinus tigrinus ALCF2SS1-7]|uniref:terpenoid synthase n=1 Tax=Lentinus tigrinus ALCF2SS1-7 TaxID=1328758 RepID=UPI001165FBA3
DTACGIAECTYAHTSYYHQRFVALYTAYLTYVDDLGHKNVEIVGRFVQRFVRGELQPIPALRRLQELLATVHEYYPRVGADAIVSSTLDGITGMYIELTTKGYVVQPLAARYTYYLRLRTGIAAGYAHMNFTKEWARDVGYGYLQMLPPTSVQPNLVEHSLYSLSFYKETLAGETDNYVHMRANAENKSPFVVLQELVDENLESVRKIEKLGASQPRFLTEICHSFMMGYVEFHFNARRYRLEEMA